MLVLACESREGCNPGLSLPFANVTLLTSISSIPSGVERDHDLEIMVALGENARSREVGEVRVLVDVDFPKVRSLEDLDSSNTRATKDLRRAIAESQLADRERLEELATEQDLLKVRAHLYGHQPDYAELFRYASFALPGRVVALANADVVLRNLDRLDSQAFVVPEESNKTRVALALTVRPPTGKFGQTCDKQLNDRCHRNSGPYDGFVFGTPLPATARYDLLEEFLPAPVYMNELAAEFRAKQFLVASGFDVINPCLNHLAEHWHCNSKKSHHQTAPVYADAWDLMVALGGKVELPAEKDTWGIKCPNERDFDDAQRPRETYNQDATTE